MKAPRWHQVNWNDLFVVDTAKKKKKKKRRSLNV